MHSIKSSAVVAMALAAGTSLPAQAYSIERVARIAPAESWEFQSLAMGRQGDLIGVAVVGEAGYGKLFRLTTAGALNTVYDFPSSNNDGYHPTGPLIESTDGSLTGSTSGGNRFLNACGSVFTVSSAGVPSLRALLDGRGSSGCAPLGSLVQAGDGALIGTSSAYSPNARDLGTIFRVEPGSLAPDAIQVSVTHVFASENGAAPDGANPVAGLVRGMDGRLYGVAKNGGLHGYGTLFSVAANGEGFVKLHDFGGADGAHPQVALTVAPDGSLWGTTSQGGASDAGTVFKVSTSGVLTSLHSLTLAEGEFPGRLVMAADGNFYGAAKDGGSADLGSIFRITPAGEFSTLLSITSDFKHPVSELVPAADGALYGATAYEIFRVTGVPTGHAPTLSMALSPATVNAGGSATLNWASTGAESCAGTAPASFAKGSYGTTGSTVIVDKSKGGGDIDYTMTCTGSSGAVSATAVLHVVAPAPTLSLVATPATLPVGASSTLSWSPTNAKACVASGAWSGNKSVKGGSIVVSKSKSGTYSYTLTCSKGSSDLRRKNPR